MKSSGSREPIDLESGLRLSAADVEAMRRARPRSAPSLEEYLEFLRSLESLVQTPGRPRRGPQGDRPFEL